MKKKEKKDKKMNTSLSVYFPFPFSFCRDGARKQQKTGAGGGACKGTPGGELLGVLMQHYIINWLNTCVKQPEHLSRP